MHGDERKNVTGMGSKEVKIGDWRAETHVRRAFLGVGVLGLGLELQ